MAYLGPFRRHDAVIAALTLVLLFVAVWHRHQIEGREQARRHTAMAPAEAKVVADSVRRSVGDADKQGVALRAENCQLKERLRRAEFDRRFAGDLQTQVDYYERKYGKAQGILPGGKK